MRIFSGIRPTGQLHIGNYLGAVKQWLQLQEKHDCIFCIVDWHAITTPYGPSRFQKRIKEIAITYLALGLDPKKCILFVQSQVKEHTELAWLLSTITPIGELGRMTQYKEKSRQIKAKPNAGLLNYPVLMAADILLYNTDIVPVGKDQEQHVELARMIARKFNQKFGRTFKIPKVRLAKGAKITAFNNPRKKMSKTFGPKSYLSLFDKPRIIEQKVMAAVTDPGKKIQYSPAKKPGVSNLLTIYSLFSKKPIKEIEKKFKGKGYRELKKSLTTLLIDSLEPFRQERDRLLLREVYIEEVLKQGAKRAQIIAASTMENVRKKMGLS